VSTHLDGMVLRSAHLLGEQLPEALNQCALRKASQNPHTQSVLFREALDDLFAKYADILRKPNG